MEKFSLTLIVSFVALSFTKAAKNDTTFLKKEIVLGSYNIVYVVEGDEYAYQELVPKEIVKEEKAAYDTSYKYMVNPVEYGVSHSNLKDFGTQWIPLHQYKGEYYVYAPSKEEDYSALMFTDSTLINYALNTYFLDMLINFNKVNNNTYRFYSVNTMHTVVNNELHIIDEAKQIAVWKANYAEGVEYQLLVNVDHIQKFPLVKSSCSMGECLNEFEFDEVNYEKLIKKALKNADKELTSVTMSE